MSEAQQKAARARAEYAATGEAHAKYREECLLKAVALAAKGLKDEAYNKLLMVVAVDSVRAELLMQTDDETIEKGVAEATASGKPN